MARYGRSQPHAPIIRHGRIAFVAATFTASYEATGAVAATSSAPFEARETYVNLISRETGLVSYWRVGEASGNLLDSKDSNPATTVAGGITRQAPGLLSSDSNGAILGDGVVGTVASVPASANLNTAAVSAECWARPTSLPGASTSIVDKFAIGGWFLECTSNGLWRWYVRPTTGSDIQVSTSAFPAQSPQAGVRHHIVGTYSVADGSRIYVNGAQVASTAAANPVGATSIVRFLAQGASSASFPGTLDEIAIYNGVLSAQQVLDHFNVGTQGLIDVYANFVAPIEATTPVAATFSLPLEATGAVQTIEAEQYTGLTPVQKTDTARWEATFAVASTFAVAWEATVGVAVTVAPAWETNSIVALTQAEPYEAPIKLAKLDVENIEAPVALATTAIANLDATTGIHATAAGALEALVSLTHSEAQPFESEEVSAQPTSTLVDTFDGPLIDETKWTITGDAHIESGELTLVGNVDVPDPKVESVLTYTLDALIVQVDPFTDTTEDFSVNFVTAGNPFIGLERTGANQLSFSYTRADGTGGTGGPIAFDYVAMRWWRFKLSGTALTVDTSPSRLEGDWTTRFTVSDYDDGGAAYTVQFAGHTYNDGSSDVYPYIYFDNLNFGPVAIVELPYERLPADLPLTSTLVDDFASPDIDSSKWQVSIPMNVFIEDGRVKLVNDEDVYANPYIRSAVLYTLDSMVFEMERVDASPFDLQLRNVEVSNVYLDLFVNEVGQVICSYQDVDGNYGDNYDHLGTYDATAMRWWQITRSGGGLAFQSSPTGFPGTWTTHLSTPSFDDGQVGYQVTLLTTSHNDPDTGDPVYRSLVYVDNFNVVPSAVPVSASFELPLESVIPVAATAQQPLEANLGVATAPAFPYEAYLPGSVIASFALPYEAGARLALALTPLPYEGFVGGITTAISAPLEATHGLSGALSFPLEAQQGTAPVSATAILSYEALVPLSATAVLAIESVAPVFALATSYIEARGQVGTLIDTEYESIQPALQLVALSWETIEQLSATLPELSWEARNALVVLFELPWISDERGAFPGHWHQSGKRLVASRGALAVAGSGRADRHSSGHLSRPRTGRRQ